MTDIPVLPDDDDDPTAPPTDEYWPTDLQPTLEQDLSVLAWLETHREQLSSDCTDYLCAALLEWSMLGELWPDPAEPIAGPDCDHLEALVQITERLTTRVVAASSVERRFELARIGRELSTAIRAQREPELLAESRQRELVHRMPWLAGRPAPLPAGWSL